MPELAAIGALGFLVCWLINLFALWRLRCQFHSPSYVNLQINLAKINLYWSEHRGQLEPLTTSSSDAWAKDQKKATRSLALIGMGCAFASWPGVALMLVILVSLKYLAKSQMEKALDGHRLGQDAQLSKAEVQKLVEELQAG